MKQAKILAKINLFYLTVNLNSVFTRDFFSLFRINQTSLFITEEWLH